MSTAFVSAAGIGRPINPAFSTMEMVSLQIKPMTTASRTKLVAITASSRQATSTISRVSPLRISPFQPARLSSAPVRLLGLAWNTPATIRPVT